MVTNPKNTQDILPGHSVSEEIPASEIASPVEAALEAHLYHVSDASPGIRRKLIGEHFTYIDLHGNPIRDPEELKRIHAIGIPPAWKDVWICPNPQGHIQATGRDAKGRKQYRYHSEWCKIRDETKYHHMITFGHALPQIRERVELNLALKGLRREKVLATIVRLLDLTSIRVGNESYARKNGSYGLTTLQDDHVSISGGTMHFHFRGKRGIEHNIDVRDPQLARIVRKLRDLHGQELFLYIDEDGELRTVESGDVNAYLKEISGHDFTAKDFRTWTGTVVVTCALLDLGPFETQAQAKKNVVRAIESAASHLGNTPAICRKSYVHPEIIDAYLDGSLLQAVQLGREQDVVDTLQDLRPDEIFVLTFLER